MQVNTTVCISHLFDMKTLIIPIICYAGKYYSLYITPFDMKTLIIPIICYAGKYYNLYITPFRYENINYTYHLLCR